MLVNRAALGFSTGVEGLRLDSKLEYLERLVASLKTNKEGYLAIKMIVRLLRSSFSPPAKHPEYESLADVVNYLETKHKLLAVAFDNFRDYMQRVKTEVGAGRVDPARDLQSQVIQDTFMHGD